MPAEQASADARRKAAREVIDILHEIATLLVCQYTLFTFDLLLMNNCRTPILIANNSHIASLLLRMAQTRRH